MIHPATGQTTETPSKATEIPHPAMYGAAAKDDETAKRWSFSASLNAYLVPDDNDYVQPTISADREWLHLEARYNYEEIGTGSVWVGYNMTAGDKVSLEFTPMVGGVFGRENGFAPGYKLLLAYGRLDLYSEGEYVFNTDDSSDSFFYTWSELAFSPTDWLRAGLVAQRTRAYETNLDIQRGLLLGVSYNRLNFTTYLFNWGWDDPLIVLSMGVSL